MAKSSGFLSALRTGIDEIGLAAARGAIAEPPALQPGVSILDCLRADHDRFRAQLAALMKAKGKHRAELFKAFKRDIAAHSRAEEKTFYRALGETVEGRMKGYEGTVEHQLIDDLLARLARGRNKDADPWTAGCQVLQELVTHHLDEEEKDDFALAERSFDAAALARLGEAFLKEKAKRGVAADGASRAAAA